MRANPKSANHSCRFSSRVAMPEERYEFFEVPMVFSDDVIVDSTITAYPMARNEVIFDGFRSFCFIVVVEMTKDSKWFPSTT